MFGSRERAKEILKILFISVFFLSSFFVYIGCGGRKDVYLKLSDVYLKLSKVIHEAFLDSVIPVSLVFSVKNLHEGDCIVNEGDKRIFRNCPITGTQFTFYGVLTQSSGRFYLEMNTVYINVNENVNEFIRNATFVFEDINPQEINLINLISACFDIVPLSANTFCLSNIGLNLSLKGNVLTFTYKFSDFSAIQIKDKIQNYVQAKFSPDFSSKVEVLEGGFLKLSVSGKLSLSGCISGDWEVSGETKSPIFSCPAEGSVNFGSQSVGFSDGKVIIDGIEKKCEEVSVCGNI